MVLARVETLRVLELENLSNGWLLANSGATGAGSWLIGRDDGW